MKYIIAFCLAMFFQLANAQELKEVEVTAGDTVYFSSCKGEAYQYMDYYKKTRFELDSISYDTISGWPFYQRFFMTGDFDVMPLPCEFEGKFGIVKHTMVAKDQEDVMRNVVIAMIVDGSSAVFIVEESFMTGEVILSPSK